MLIGRSLSNRSRLTETAAAAASVPTILPDHYQHWKHSRITTTTTTISRRRTLFASTTSIHCIHGSSRYRSSTRSCSDERNVCHKNVSSANNIWLSLFVYNGCWLDLTFNVSDVITPPPSNCAHFRLTASQLAILSVRLWVYELFRDRSAKLAAAECYGERTVSTQMPCAAAVLMPMHHGCTPWGQGKRLHGITRTNFLMTLNKTTAPVVFVSCWRPIVRSYA